MRRNPFFFSFFLAAGVTALLCLLLLAVMKRQPVSAPPVCPVDCISNGVAGPVRSPQFPAGRLRPRPRHGE